MFSALRVLKSSSLANASRVKCVHLFSVLADLTRTHRPSQHHNPARWPSWLSLEMSRKMLKSRSQGKTRSLHCTFLQFLFLYCLNAAEGTPLWQTTASIKTAVSGQPDSSLVWIMALLSEYRNVPTFHRVVCFDVTDIERLRNLKKGAQVFVQADFSIKEPEPDTDPRTPQGQKQISLMHSMSFKCFWYLELFFIFHFRLFQGA